MLMLAQEKSTWLRPCCKLTVRSSSTSVNRPFWMSIRTVSRSGSVVSLIRASAATVSRLVNTTARASFVAVLMFGSFSRPIKWCSSITNGSRRLYPFSSGGILRRLYVTE